MFEHSPRIYPQLRPTPRCELRLHARDVLVSEPKVSVVRHVHQGRAKILRHIHRSISVSVTPILSKTHADRVSNSQGFVHTLHVSRDFQRLLGKRLTKFDQMILKRNVIPVINNLGIFLERWQSVRMLINC